MNVVQLKLVEPDGETPEGLVHKWIADDEVLFKAWKDYVSMRIMIKKPMTPRAKERAMNKLWNLKNAGHSPLLVLFQSEDKNYTDLYPPKGEYLQWL